MPDFNLDYIPINHEQGERIIRALDQIAGNSAESAEVLDATFKALLDGTNTSRVFGSWYPRAKALQGENVDRYELLDRFARMAAEAVSDKKYTLRSYHPDISGDTAMTPLDDLAGVTQAQIYNETDTVVEDWTDEDPIGGWYIRTNALSLSDGTMNVLAVEGESGFDISGETAPVYTFALALWTKEWDDGSYVYKSWATVQKGDMYPYPGDVAPDGTKRNLTWHPSFEGGLNSDGNLTSGADIAPYIFASANAGLTAARKWNSYEGLWNDCDTKWLLDMWQLRHWNLENSGILEGCLSYNLQYEVAKAETGVKRVIVTTGQAANFVEGSAVAVGDYSAGNADRGQATMRNIVSIAKIASIETVTVDGGTFAALNLDVDEPFDVIAGSRVSTMPWYSGSTEKVPGHKDGCIGSKTAGKTPIRVMGVEAIGGAYTIGIEPLYNVTVNGTDNTKFDYGIYECRDSVNLSGSVTQNHVLAKSVEMVPSGWQYVKSFIRTKLGFLFPEKIGGDSSHWMKSAFSGAGSAGVRVPWRFMNLNNGGNGGLAGENGNNTPGNANWNSRPRLS